MGAPRISLPDWFYKGRLGALLYEPFIHYTDGDIWTKLASDTGSTVAVGDYPGGKAYLATGATSHNQAALYTTNKCFNLNKPIFGEWLIDYTEANTNTAQVAVGFSSSPGSGLLQNAAAGPAASFSGALIYKVSGETVWRCVSSLSTTQTITKSTTTAGGSTPQDLKIEVIPVTSTIAEVSFWCNGQQLIDASQTSRNVPIKHYVTYTGYAQMAATNYIKSESANSEVLHVDSVMLAQGR
jgi:hypothetical protein